MKYTLVKSRDSMLSYLVKFYYLRLLLDYVIIAILESSSTKNKKNVIKLKL